jgi:hypothetical protein
MAIGAVHLTMEGLWTVEFGSSAGMFGGGVVVFRDGKILGGDSLYYYVGEYSFQAGTLKATLTISPFIEGAESVFKTVGQDLTMDLIGSLTSEHSAIAQGQLRKKPEQPELKFGAKLTRRT